MGTNFSTMQRDILVNKGVRRVYICFDREYRDELFFTKGDMTDMVSKYGYEDLSDGWYAYIYILPGSTNEPQH